MAALPDLALPLLATRGLDASSLAGADARVWESCAASLIDELEQPILVARGDGCVRCANRGARELLAAGAGLFTIAGRLSAETPEATRQLGWTLQRLARGHVVEELLVLPATTTGPPLRIRLVHLPSAEVALLIESSHDSTPSPAELRDRFDLSVRESEVAGQLARGESLAEIAAEHGTTVNTVRGHLKSVFVKTKVHRQAELVALLLR